MEDVTLYQNILKKDKSVMDKYGNITDKTGIGKSLYQTTGRAVQGITEGVAGAYDEGAKWAGSST